MTLDDCLDFVFPSNCVACGKPLTKGRILCEPCNAELPRSDTLFCGRCLARLPEKRRICHPDHPYVLAAATIYDNDTVRALIHELKFESNARAAEPLAALLVRYLRALALSGAQHDHIIPVPLGPARLRERGFNQAALLGEHVARAFGIGYLTDALLRTKETRPQTDQENIDARRQNVADCFRVSDKMREAITHKNIILVDDVRTTGSTLEAAARALKDAGARRILGLVVAKT